MKHLFLFIAATILMFGNKIASAQTEKEQDLQISFIYPIGSGGISSINNVYKNSLNILGGINGGINGVEIGSLFNINKGNVEGAQIGGLFNFTTGQSQGGIIAGIANINGGNTKGALIAGVANACNSDVECAQIAGCVNLARNIDGAQISVINIATESVSGAQVGVINHTKTMDLKPSVQVGVINTAKAINGTQVGVINSSKKIKGSQIGVINACDSISNGIPIGVISFVRHGYFAFEIGTSELLNGTISYKMGTEHFYNIFKVGMGSFDGKTNFVTGYGIGSLVNIKNPHQLAFELISNHVVHDGKWADHINTINTLSARYKYNFNKNLSFVVGPTANLYITDQKIGNDFGNIHTPYTLYKKIHNGKQFSAWVGASAGFVLSL